MLLLFVETGRDRHPSGSGEGYGPRGTPPDAAGFGLKLFLASLAMLFGASLIGYVLTRAQTDEWTGYHVEGFGLGIAISTVLLVSVSALLHHAVRAARRGAQAASRRALLLALLAALGFLANQAHNWWRLVEVHGGLMTGRDLSLFLFYALTAVHAIHVVGGFPPLLITAWKTSRGRYGPGDTRGVEHCALYWHFLDGVWVIIAILLWIG